MLRCLTVRPNGVLSGVSRRLSSHMNPSTTTSVLLSSLPSTIVETKLKEEVSKVNCRKVQLEPGCSFHFTNECEARVAAELVKSKYNLEVSAEFRLNSFLLRILTQTVSIDYCIQSINAMCRASQHSRRCECGCVIL